MSLSPICLKKREDRRIRAGHPWIFSNEIDTALTPLKKFKAGEEVTVIAADKTVLGVGYVNPHSLIAVRIFSTHSNDRLNQDFLTKQLQTALLGRTRLFNKPYYRLAFSEADGLPGLVIDRFGPHLVVQLNTAGMECKKEEILIALRTLLPDVQSILLRNDSPIRVQEGMPLYVTSLFGEVPSEYTLEENDVLFTVSSQEGQKTGWFYDHRLNRARLKQYVKDQTVLDVFSYVGGFGIQAAAFGAKQVDCIDASQSACDYIQRNAAKNKLSERVQSINEDAFTAMKQLLATKQRYGIITLDPPAFVKKAKDLKEGLLAYQRINELALKLLAPNGILFSCSCSMHLKWEDLLQAVQRAALQARCQVQILERGHQGPDHPVHIAIPESDYLKALVVRKLDG